MFELIVAVAFITVVCVVLHHHNNYCEWTNAERYRRNAYRSWEERH